MERERAFPIAPCSSGGAAVNERCATTLWGVIMLNNVMGTNPRTVAYSPTFYCSWFVTEATLWFTRSQDRVEVGYC